MHSILNTPIKAEQFLSLVENIKDKIPTQIFEKVCTDILSNIAEPCHIILRNMAPESLIRALSNYYRRLKPFSYRCTIPELKTLLNIDKHKFKHICVFLGKYIKIG